MNYFPRNLKLNNAVAISPDCKRIIHNAALEAALIGAGLAQVPGADHILISALQINMVKDLAKVQGRSLSEGAIKGMLLSFLATQLGRSASKFLISWIPVAGNLINAATAASITEAFGLAALKTMQKDTYPAS